MMARTTGSTRAAATRELILSAAERLFAEHGVVAVSNRQVSEAAGQGNNTAVGYHFGSKVDLIRAILRKHSSPIEQLRAEMVAEVGDSADVRDWVACVVRPSTRYLAALGAPTWFGRFGAQVMTDPAYRQIMVAESLNSPSLLRATDGLHSCLPDLPLEVRLERRDMVRQLMVHMIAERERALAEGEPTPRRTWEDAANGLIDGIVGLYMAPVTGPAR
ncbi:TetR family transcriptional regulator [Saccharopolyspora sp. NPDC000359]|uniref:TetR/AcrR family transcriptional regulator n=1 Tax=Saccharopolyspora sp. NPDC000359 TaxID=3154251 RepID=UPI00331BB232